MKKLTPLFIVAMLFLTQRNAAQPILKNKFSIQLPNEWKNNPRFLDRLSRIIKMHIPQLEQREECFGCNAAYRVSFHITPASVNYVYHHPTSSSQFTTYYSFFSYMDVSDSIGNVVHRLILVDSLMDHAITKNLYGRGTTTPPVQNSIAQAKSASLPMSSPLQTEVTVLKRTERELARTNVTGMDDYIKKNIGQLAPSARDLWDKVEEVLRDFQLEEEAPATAAEQ